MGEGCTIPAQDGWCHHGSLHHHLGARLLSASFRVDGPGAATGEFLYGRIGKAIEPAIEPLGFDWKLGIGILSGVGAKELVVSSLGVLYADDAEADETTLAQRLPITPLVAYGYMVFILLYFPCVATLAAIRQEAGGWKWAAFAAAYTTVLAWIMSFAVYQIGELFV